MTEALEQGWDTSTGLLRRLLEGLQPLQASDANVIFDDLEVVLGPHRALDEWQVPALTLRMSSHLRFLISMAGDYAPTPEVVDLQARARALLDREAPSDPSGAQGLLRRTALAALALLDQLEPLPVPSP
ncbi:DUF6415 family natural product biosynthesis protein [Streptomyces sp. NPDC058611]|uniref:DUF6415 family natural product biosynthesis protein n=1 Tax=unclassified Streptomyces TaxID=2593676 RepID=UPI0036576EF3